MIRSRQCCFTFFYLIILLFGISRGYFPGSVAKKMCRMYFQETYLGNSTCAVKDALSFDPGSYEAKKGEFPHMVQIGYIENDRTIDWACSGSLISRNFVITTARCVRWSFSKNKPKVIRAGMTNHSDLSRTQIRNIVEFIRHPDYKFGILYNNIALVKVDKDFNFNYFVKPACLYTNRTDPISTSYRAEVKGVNTGWGSMKLSKKHRENMIKIYEFFVPRFICSNIFDRNRHIALHHGFLYEKMLCAGVGENGTECQREYGSPLQIEHEEMGGTKCIYDIIGVSAYFICGLPKELPVTLYIRVSYYLEWIEENVWGEYIQE